jgi:hypothetical protein
MEPTRHLSDKLESWVSRIPGLKTYQEREHRRETDKKVREQLSAKIRAVCQKLQSLERRLAGQGNLDPLPELDRICSRLQQLADTVLYAGYGYGGIFDLDKIRQEQLERMCEFDLYLFDDVEAMEQEAGGLGESGPQDEKWRQAISELDTRCDILQERLDRRREFMTRPE